MKTNSKHLPQRILAIGRMQHHINYALTVGVDEDGNTDYNYETALINGDATHDMIVQSIIADKYSFEAELALINNFNMDKQVDEYMSYMQFRQLAKWIAEEERLLTAEEVETHNATLKKIKITIPLSKVVDGGVYAPLADMLIKTKAIHTTIVDKVVVYLSYLLPEHRALLEADPDVLIEE